MPAVDLVAVLRVGPVEPLIVRVRDTTLCLPTLHFDAEVQEASDNSVAACLRTARCLDSG